MEVNKVAREHTEKHEARLKEHLELKRELLLEEKELKKALPLDKLDPDFAYENDPSWLEHLRKIACLNIDREVVALDKQLSDLELNALDRVELDKKTKEMEERVR